MTYKNGCGKMDLEGIKMTDNREIKSNPNEETKPRKVSDVFKLNIERASQAEREHMAMLADEFAKKFQDKYVEADEEAIEATITIERPITKLSSLAETYERFRRYNKGKGVAADTIKYYETNYNRLSAFLTFTLTDVESYQRMSLDMMVKHGSIYPIVALEQSNFEEEYREYLTDVEGLKPHTVLNAMRAYRAFYYFCSRENEWLKPKKIIIKDIEPHIKPLYTKEQLDKILEQPDMSKATFVEYRDWVIVNYAYNTANRRGSICGIQMKDLAELEDGYISIQVQKNKKPKRLYVPAKVVSILRKYIKLTRSEATNEDYLFCSDRGQKLTPNALSQSIRKYMENRLGDDCPKEVGLHLLRHQYAAEYMKGETANIFDLQKQLGHDTLYMTKYYADKYGQPNGDNLELHAPINKRKATKGYSKMKVDLTGKKVK